MSTAVDLWDFLILDMGFDLDEDVINDSEHGKYLKLLKREHVYLVAYVGAEGIEIVAHPHFYNICYRAYAGTFFPTPSSHHELLRISEWIKNAVEGRHTATNFIYRSRY